MSTLKRLSVIKNFEELESKVIELTKDNFNWITECQICDENDDLIGTKLLILSNFKYKYDEDFGDKILSVKITYENYLSDKVKDVSDEVHFDLFKNDDLFKDGTLGVQTRDSNVLYAFYTLFEKMDLL